MMLRKLLLGTALGTFAVISSANALLIDNFNIPDNGASGPITILQLGAPGDTGFVTYNAAAGFNGGANIIGDNRDLRLQYISNSNAVGNAQAVISNGGTLTHSQDSGVTATTTVRWDNLGTGRDLTDGGASSMFHIKVVQADLGISWRLTVTDSDNDTSSIFFDSAAQINPPGADLFESFSLFSPLINFASITKIEFQANIDANGNSAVDRDTTIDIIETVPEPATLALLGLGLAGLGLTSRRRRKA